MPDEVKGDETGKVARPGVVSCIVGACKHAMKLKYLAILLILILLKHVIGPSKPYIINSFFAARHDDGGDCSIEPNSDPCRQGATDAASYHAVSEALSHVLGTLMGVTLGSCSDIVGRRPLIRISAILHFLVFVALALHVWGGWTLLIYLIAHPVVEAFEVSGVFIALVLDIGHVIPDKESRKLALMVFGGVMLPIGVACILLAFSLSHHHAMMVSLLAASLQVVYVFVGFPETALVAAAGAPPPSLCAIAGHVRRMVTRNGFIPRLMVVVALLTFAGSGLSVILPPYMMGYIGFTRHDKLKVLEVVVPSTIALLAISNFLINKFGIMRVLQGCLAMQLLLPVLCLLCTEVWHLLLLFMILSPPTALAGIVLLRIKYNLVGDDEQGLVMGAVSSVGKGAAVLGLLFFGWLFHYSTHGGVVGSRSSILAPYLIDAAIFLLALLFCLSMPKELPDRPQVATEKEPEPACSSEADVAKLP